MAPRVENRSHREKLALRKLLIKERVHNYDIQNVGDIDDDAYEFYMMYNSLNEYKRLGDITPRTFAKVQEDIATEIIKEDLINKRYHKIPFTRIYLRLRRVYVGDLQYYSNLSKISSSKMTTSGYKIIISVSGIKTGYSLKFVGNYMTKLLDSIFEEVTQNNLINTINEYHKHRAYHGIDTAF